MEKIQSKCVVFARVSTQKQTLEQQEELLIKEANRRGYYNDDVILISEHESGSKLLLDERIGIAKLKNVLAKYNDIDCIIIYELSRLSRRPADLYQIRDLFVSRKINLISLAPPMELLDSNKEISNTGSMIFGIFGSLAEQEGYLRVQRMMRGKERKKNEGKLSVGRPLFGYTLDNDHRPIPHPQDSLIIQEIFNRYSNLESSGSIGKDLWLRKALHTKSQKMITYQTYICWLLKDERYAGLKNSIYPPIISKELFNKCKEIMANKPEHFKRKSKTICTYPLQGYIYTEDGYCLTPSITNNRYVKMTGISKHPISLNMKAADELTRLVLKQYLDSGILDIDRQKQYDELNDLYEKNQTKLANIDYHIQQLQDENDRINRRIIKGRMSETEGDKLIDHNVQQMYELENTRNELRFSQTNLSNKLIILANPLLSEEQQISLDSPQDLKNAVHKYIKKIIAVKIGFSNYRLTYKFLDGTEKIGEFLSLKSGVQYSFK